jgi:Putative metal-binding motif
VKRTILVRMAPLCLLVLLVCASSTAMAAVTTYSSLGSFLEALGSTPTLENFDDFESGTQINDQIPGVVVFSSNAPLDGYRSIQVEANDGASSAPNMLAGGSIPGNESQVPQVIILEFEPNIFAFAFYLTAYHPDASPASIRVDFANDPHEDFSLGNDTESELTPIFFGAISDAPIKQVSIDSGFVGETFEDFGIDDLRFSAASEEDSNPPVCSGSPQTEEGVLGINGTGTEIGEFESGIQSVGLDEGATNLSLVVSDFEPGATSVSFRVTQTDPSLNAQGKVIVTDLEGNICVVSASFRGVDAPIENEVLCQDTGLLLTASNANNTPPGTSACSANPPGGDEPAFPPGYARSDPTDPFPCQIFTLDAPITGTTELILKKDGLFNPDLRLLFSHSQIVGGETVFPDFTDITEFVEQIDSIIPDPTRVKGTGEFSPVKVACAIQNETTRKDFCDGLPAESAGPDDDGDGYTLCAASASDVDCNDQFDAIFPGAGEVCNGLDDNCDGTADEDDPPGIACPVFGQVGACRDGVTSCATLPLVCEQTVFPVEEVACNGVDDDCDGSLDEVYQFSGFLPPIKEDGSVVFLKKRGAIPVKFQLTNCSGGFITNSVATIELLRIGDGIGGDVVVDVGSVGSANTGNLFRYDPDGNQYIYNLDASVLTGNSTYRILAHLDDGTTHSVVISIK